MSHPIILTFARRLIAFIVTGRLRPGRNFPERQTGHFNPEAGAVLLALSVMSLYLIGIGFAVGPIL